MKRRPYVSPEYAKRLDDLAGLLLRPIGDTALQDTIEFEPVQLTLIEGGPTAESAPREAA